MCYFSVAVCIRLEVVSYYRIESCIVFACELVSTVAEKGAAKYMPCWGGGVDFVWRDVEDIFVSEEPTLMGFIFEEISVHRSV